MYENNKYVDNMFRIKIDDESENDNISCDNISCDNKEEINVDTGERNPNLIYDDDTLKKEE